MKLNSLKESYQDYAQATPADKKKEFYPSLYLDGKQLKALGLPAGAKVGDDLTMVATIHICSKSESENGTTSASFEILEAAVEPKENGPDPASVLYPNEKAS